MRASADQHQDERAATLLGSATRLRATMGLPVLAPFASQHEACEEAARARLGEAGSGRPFARARALLSPLRSDSSSVGTGPGRPRSRPPEALRGRSASGELEIARMVAEGPSNKEVAAWSGWSAS